MKNYSKVIVSNQYTEMYKEKTLSLLGQKIQILLLFLIKNKNNDFEEITITKEMLKKAGFHNSNINQKLKEVAKELIAYNISFCDEEGEWVETSLCSAVYQDGNAYQFKFSDVLKPLLLQLTKNFTQIDINALLSLGKASHTVDLYFFLKSKIFNTNKSVNFSVELLPLRKILGCKNKYPHWYNFNRMVLKPSIEEINNKTDLKIEFKGKRGSSRHIAKVEFNIKKQPYQGEFYQLLEYLNPVEYRDYDFSSEIEKICKTLSFKIVGDNIDFLSTLINDYTEDIVLRALKSIDTEWKDSDNNMRGAVVRGQLEYKCKSVLKTREMTQKLKEIIKDENVLEAVVVAERKANDKHREEIVSKDPKKYYDRYDESFKSFFYLEEEDNKNNAPLKVQISHLILQVTDEELEEYKSKLS